MHIVIQKAPPNTLCMSTTVSWSSQPDAGKEVFFNHVVFNVVSPGVDQCCWCLKTYLTACC